MIFPYDRLPELIRVDVEKVVAERGWARNDPKTLELQQIVAKTWYNGMQRGIEISDRSYQ